VSSIGNYVTLFRKLIVGVVHQPHQSKRCDENSGHAQQALLHQLIVLLCLSDFYLREEVNGHQDRKLLSFSDKLRHFVRDLLRERCGNKKIKVFLIVRSNVRDMIFRNPPSLNNPCGKVCALFRGDPDAVCGSDWVRKPLKQLGQESGEFQTVELLASRHTREGVC
jgi:hypothetical protein